MTRINALLRSSLAVPGRPGPPGAVQVPGLNLGAVAGLIKAQSLIGLIRVID
jgi:hypothetical protein